MNTLEVLFVFFCGFVSALPITVLFAVSMRRQSKKNKQVPSTVLPDAIYIDGHWQKFDGNR